VEYDLIQGFCTVPISIRNASTVYISCAVAGCQLFTFGLLEKILWWYCWTKVDYVESISRLLSIPKDKVPVFPTCLLPEKRHSDNDFCRLIDFGRRV